MERLLSTPEAAQLLGVAPDTLKVWRWRRTGPPSVRVGRLVRYRSADLDSWLTEGLRPRAVGK